MSERRARFAQHMLAMTTGAAMLPLVGLGHRLGLFDALLASPATSVELADRAGLQERYVREWLGAMATGGILDIDDGRFVLPAEHAPFLAGEGASNVGPSASMLQAMIAALPELERCFVEGGGVGYDRFSHHLATVGAVAGDSWQRIYDEQLVDGFLGRVPGLTERLTEGATLLDLGCGAGHAITVAAAAFPRSRFTGVDLQSELIARAEAARTERGLANATFVAADAAHVLAGAEFDVITAFDAVHDAHDPAHLLSTVYSALAPGGVFVMVDAKFSSDVERNIGSPHAALCYAISLMFCTTVSLAENGAALGAMWGMERAQAMLEDAGFRDIEILDSPRPQNCTFVCKR